MFLSVGKDLKQFEQECRIQSAFEWERFISIGRVFKQSAFEWESTFQPAFEREGTILSALNGKALFQLGEV